MADVYSRANSFGGSFSADGAMIVFSTGGTSATSLLGTAGSNGVGGVGLLTQNAQVSYSQQITRLYEVGSNQTFFIAGRTQGQLSMSRILGPRPVQTAFYTTYGNVCNAANNNFSIVMNTNCGASGGSGSSGATIGGGLGSIAFLIKNVVIVSLGVSIAAQDMILNEQFQAMFVSLELQS